MSRCYIRIAMKSASEKQLAANRANAARSTGPRTPEGKLRSALNSRKHGLTASTFTASGVEESEELQNLIDDAVAHYQPQGSQEQFAVERIALCQLAILRAHRIEAGLLGSAFAGGKQLVPSVPRQSTRYRSLRRRLSPDGRRRPRLRPPPPLSSPSRPPIPPSHRRLRPPQSPTRRNPKRTHF